MSPEHFWWGGWWMFPMMMPLFMLIFAVFIIYGVFGRGSVRPPWWRNDSSSNSQGAETPIEILKKRYAKGEISREEFEQMKRDLAA